MSLTLTRDELIDLTDYKYPKKQIEALTRMGIPFEVTPLGRPKVLRIVLERKHDPRGDLMGEPDFDAI